MKDINETETQADHARRRQLFLEYSVAASPTGRTGFFSQMARLELGRGPVDEAPICEGIAFVDSRQDCCDFAAAGLLRMLYRFHDSSLLSQALIAEIEACLLRFKYWWDEPNGDNNRCYHTENHQIIFHADELLAGQLFRDRTFANSGQNGVYHIAHAEHLIRRWLEFRVRFGFSEWLSNCYFDEDLLALVNLYDFAQAPDIRQRAEMLIDLILFETALHSHQGVFGSTHGRSYAEMIKGGRAENTAAMSKLMLGVGRFNNPSNSAAICLATSSYRAPALLEQIASDLEPPQRIRERHSLNIEDAPAYGLSYDQLEDGHLYWSIQEYGHPAVLALSQRMTSTFGVRQHANYQRYADAYQQQRAEHGQIVDAYLDCHALSEVNIETYRTADYMLSCAQDYRPGRPGYQQHIWQATLGLDAVVFTNHPGAADETSRPNFWAGNGVMPRAAQIENVLLCLYRTPEDDPFPFSHAYFPQDAFDEVIEQGNWVCARKGDGYIGLFSQHAPRWREAAGQIVELRTDHPTNMWICELGRRVDWGSFAAFVQSVVDSRIICDGTHVAYDSPSQGAITFGWEEPLRLAGEAVALRGYARFDNRYCQCAFDDPEIVIQRGDARLRLNFAENERMLAHGG